MKKKATKPLTGDKLAVRLCTASLWVMTAGLLALYFVTGYRPLLSAAIIMALPTLVHLALLLPVVKAVPIPEPEPEAETEKADKKRHRKHPHLAAQLFNRYASARNGIVTVITVVAVVGLHLLFWKLPALATPEKLGYYVPVILAGMFVLSIVLEKWCRYAQNDNAYTRAQLRGIRSALEMGRVVQLLCALALMLKLLGFYDAQAILQVLLAILLVYESLFIAFSLAVRVIRHELATAPEFLISMPGLDGSDTNILRYLEENTGITMRSLWSMQLVKKVLPGALMGIVLLVWLSTCVVQVEAHQQGALYRLGKLQNEALEPGIHLTLPWPLDKVDVYNTKSLNRVTIGYICTGDQDNTWTEAHGSEEHRLLLGGGNELISINLQIEYRIGDLHSYIKGAAAPESLLEAICYEIVTARTIGSDLDTMLSTDRNAFSESFRQELVERLEPYHTGLTVENVVLESIHPPVEVATVFQRLIGASIDAKTYIINAQTSANASINNAMNQQTAAIGDAKVQHFTAVGEARSAVSEFMASVDASAAYPDAYAYYKYRNAMIQANGNSTLIILGDGINEDSVHLFSIDNKTATEETDLGYAEDYYDQDDYMYDEEY